MLVTMKPTRGNSSPRWYSTLATIRLGVVQLFVLRVFHDVVVEGRDQRTRLAAAGRDLLLLREGHDLVSRVPHEVVGRDADCALVDALDTPLAVVVVDRGALTGCPDHHHHRVVLAGVQESSGIRIRRGFGEPDGELQPTPRDRLHE